jgi:hypothetical protein
VRSYLVDAEFSKQSLPAYQPSLTAIGLSSEAGGPAAGQPNAVVYFYWPGRKLPSQPSGVHNNTLELHYQLAALGGILQLLQGEEDFVCFYSDDATAPLNPRAGLEQVAFHAR